MIPRVVGLAALLRATCAVQFRGNVSANLSAVPNLQPAAVYDQDFPVDMASKTPQELRYQAQADYARAINRLKEEAAQAEAARMEMEKQLKVLEAAKAAAEKAAAEAEKAKADAAALKAAASKEGSEAAQEQK